MGDEIRGRQRIAVPFDGHVIGQGYRSDTAERVGTGLDVAEVREDPAAPGQRTVFTFQMVTSQESLERSMNLGIEADVRYGLLSVGGKFSFAETNAINTTSTYIVASCVVMNALRFGAGFTPNETARDLIRAGDTEGFRTAFGDRFTQALRTGGEFHAIVRISSSDTTHQKAVSASLHAELNGLAAGGSFKAAYSEAQKDTRSTTRVDINVQQNGGRGDQIQIPGTDANLIRAYMNNFAESAHQNPVAYEAELVTYDTLALPFPPPAELEDRRRVLEDALTLRRRYWSALSQLDLARSEDGQLLFTDLPSEETLVELQAEFRRCLNALMAHVRAVSKGEIAPAVFVPEGEPVLPRFKRRQASRFAEWWVKRAEPGLPPDDQTLITRIADKVQREIAPTVIDDLPPQAVEDLADRIDELDVSWRVPWETLPRLRSLASLPKMIDAPLTTFTARGTQLRDLHGIEPFSRLKTLMVTNAELEDISALTAVAGVRELQLSDNLIADLEPLRSLTALEALTIGGNKVVSLDPLAALSKLRLIAIGHHDFDWMFRDDTTIPFRLADNPIRDARALAKLPLLVNPFVSSDQLQIRIFDRQAQPICDGVASRLGTSNRFRFSQPTGGATEAMQLIALINWEDLDLFPEPIVLSVIHFTERNIQCIASTRPDDRSQFLPVADVQRVFSSRAADRLNLELYSWCALLDPARLQLAEAVVMQ